VGLDQPALFDFLPLDLPRFFVERAELELNTFLVDAELHPQTKQEVEEYAQSYSQSEEAYGSRKAQPRIEPTQNRLINGQGDAGRYQEKGKDAPKALVFFERLSHRGKFKGGFRKKIPPMLKREVVGKSTKNDPTLH
jgi:hypothetical protein